MKSYVAQSPQNYDLNVYHITVTERTRKNSNSLKVFPENHKKSLKVLVETLPNQALFSAPFHEVIGRNF
jgi:hypothetical protein